MEFFLIFLLVIFFIYIIVKSNKGKNKQMNSHLQNYVQENVTPKIEVRVTSSSSTNDNFKYPPVKSLNDSEWILNPSSSFKLTLKNCNQSIAEEIRSMLDNDELYGYNKIGKLVGLFSKHNVLVKEVEAYKSKYKPIYFSKINELKGGSDEWKNAYEADKVDLMDEFREIALESLYERPNVDLVSLFENEPKDITLDDELINEYGFENCQTYLKYSDKPDKIRVFPKDHYERPKFEELEKLNLAERGYNLPKEEILLTLTLKELNSIAKHPEKEFRRKQQAVEYILTKPNIEELIGKNISLREIFRLKPLPQKYSNVNLEEISSAWNYTNVIVQLLETTYRNAYYFDRNKKDGKEEREYIKGYKIHYHRDDIHCQCCKEQSEKTYSKNNLPRFPLHIGCNCFVDTIYDFD